MLKKNRFSRGNMVYWKKTGRTDEGLQEHSAKKKEPVDTVLPVDAEDTLLPFLMKKLPKLSRNNVKSLLSHHQVSVEGVGVSRHDQLLKPGQTVQINWGLVRNIRQPGNSLRILYEDADVIVIDKPAGMLSMASDTEKEKTAYHLLTDYVRRKEPEGRIFIVHRLDRDTSGVMMFARTEQAKRIMQDHWKERVKDRAYLALVEGTMEKPEGRVHSWLKETASRLMYSCGENSGGQEAITNYRLLSSAWGYSLLEVRLDTGRKNQIRVHMKDLGHSIVGDKRYGAQDNPLGRLGLHAHILEFLHPTTNECLRFETEIPSGFKRMLQQGARPQRDGKQHRTDRRKQGFEKNRGFRR